LTDNLFVLLFSGSEENDRQKRSILEEVEVDSSDRVKRSPQYGYGRGYGGRGYGGGYGRRGYGGGYGRGYGGGYGRRGYGGGYGRGYGRGYGGYGKDIFFALLAM